MLLRYKLFSGLLFFYSIAIAQTLFNTTNLVEEFGDKIGEVESNVSNGLFSNSATNNSPLLVKTVLYRDPDLSSVDEYKAYIREVFPTQGYSDEEIELALRYAKSGFKMARNSLGTIRFKLFEYNEHKASMIGVKSGVISIKTSNGDKLRADLGEYDFVNGYVEIKAYKEITSGATGVKNQIRFGYYDWNQTLIFNELVNADSKVDVVIAFGSSTYKFSLEPN